jgi:serine/threonine protein kinase
MCNSTGLSSIACSASSIAVCRGSHVAHPNRSDPQLPLPSRMNGRITSPPRGAGEGAGQVCPSCGAEYGPDIRFCPQDGSTLRPKAQSGAELVGRVIDERYHLLEKIGEGGMGRVYLAEHLRTQRRCAIKVISRALTHDPEAVGRFGREATNASRISHPNVAAVYDFGETDDGLLYLALEYVEGAPLSQLLEREGILSPARATEITRQVAEGLSAAHELGIVHRDLKPSNIIIACTRKGSDLAKVVDFGIAKATGEEQQQLTRTGFVIGTPEYMSPEQLIGDPVDPRSDIYSLGCILYEMLVGEHAFGGAAAQVITRRLTEPPPRPRAKNPQIPKPLDEIVVRALGRAPEERFQTVEALRDALLLAPAQPVSTGPRRIAAWLGLGAPRSEPRAEPVTPGAPHPSPAAVSAGHAVRQPHLTPGGGPTEGAEPPPAPVSLIPPPVTPGPSPSLPGAEPEIVAPASPVPAEPQPPSGEHMPQLSTPPAKVWAAHSPLPLRRPAHAGVAFGAALLLVAGVALSRLGADRSEPAALTPPGAKPSRSAALPAPTLLPPEQPEGRLAPPGPPEVQAPQSTDPPQPVAAFSQPVLKKERAEPKSPAPAELRLTGLVPRSTVRVNGKAFAGKRVVLTPGTTYSIEVAAPGFAAATWRGSLVAGEQRSWRPQMRPIAQTEQPGAALGEETFPFREREQTPAGTDRVVSESASTARLQETVAVIRENIAIGRVRANKGEYQASVRMLRSASEQLAALAQQHPDAPEVHTLRAQLSTELADVQRECRAEQAVAIRRSAQPPVCE